MATSKTLPAAIGSISICQQIENQINAKNTQLNNWKYKLEILLNDTNSDLDEIQAIRGIFEEINKELLRLKAEQQKQGCQSGGSSEVTNDNQTVISTSSVRRKDARALQVIAIPSSGLTSTS